MDPTEDLTGAILRLMEEIVELQGIIENLRMTMIRQNLGVYNWKLQITTDAAYAEAGDTHLVGVGNDLRFL